MTKYQCGIVSDAYAVPSIVQRLNALTSDDIRTYKQRSHEARRYCVQSATRTCCYDSFMG